MKNRQGERGSMNVLLVPVILLTILFVGAASFAVWAFGGRQDYKNNSDAKAAAAVEANTKVVKTEDAKEFAEESKKPLRAYDGPEAYGSLRVMYPKTWSAYVSVHDNGGSQPLDAYFHSDYVPSTDMKQAYNLRIQVTGTAYDVVLKRYESLVKGGKVTVAPYKLPKVSGVNGTRLDGTIIPGNSNATGTMVLLPMRDKTLQLWTESPTFLPDFTDNILPNLTFSP